MIGKFIVFEGINGCGKGTQLFTFAKKLYELDKSQTVFITREPNEFDENGQSARKILHSDGNPYMNAKEAVKYFARNRKTHNAIFTPLLENNINVISDRYYNSNFAFQHAQGISYEKIAIQNREARIPDLTLILDVPVAVAFERLSRRDGNDRRKFDRDFEFVQKARANYLEQPQILEELMQDTSIMIIDGTNFPEKVAENIWQAYTDKFKPFH